MATQQPASEHSEDLERNMVSKEGSNLHGTNKPPRAVYGGQEQTRSNRLSFSQRQTRHA
jgi:hypothetical protein